VLVKVENFTEFTGFTALEWVVQNGPRPAERVGNIVRTAAVGGLTVTKRNAWGRGFDNQDFEVEGATEAVVAFLREHRLTGYPSDREPISQEDRSAFFEALN
jgi:hypothetical protein